MVNTQPKTLTWTDTDIFGRPRIHRRLETPAETAERERIASIDAQARQAEALSRACHAVARDAHLELTTALTARPDPADQAAVRAWLTRLAELRRIRDMAAERIGALDSEAAGFHQHVATLAAGLPSAVVE
jgi:hypothetical protein